MKISLMSLIRLEKAWYDIVEEDFAGKPANERRRAREVADQALAALKNFVELEFPFSVDLSELKSTFVTQASVAHEVAYPRFLSSTATEIRRMLQNGNASSSDVQTALTVEEMKQTVRSLAEEVAHCRATVPANHCNRLLKNINDIEKDIHVDVEEHVSKSDEGSVKSSGKKKRGSRGRSSDTASTVDDDAWFPAEVVEESGRVAERAQELIDLVAHVKKRTDTIVPIMEQEMQARKKKQKRK